MKFLAILTFLLTAPAHADDVLFLDMNASYMEIKAAEAAAKKAKRGFVAFPPMSDAQRKELYEANTNVQAIETKMAKACNGPANPKCTAISSAYRSARDKQVKLTKAFQVEPKKLAAFLAEQDASGRKFGSVVISGHDGTGSISGHLGSVNDEAMLNLFQNSSSVKDSLRSLYLWGCYTASPSSILLNWKSKFPYMNLIAGYDGRAPLSDKPAGWKYLAGALEKEEALHAITDSKKLRDALGKIPFAAQVHSAIATCDSYANLKEHFQLSAFTEKCDALGPKLKEREEEYQCYQRAQKAGCENPPEDTSGGALRQFYQLVQNAEACAKTSRDPVFRYGRAEAMNLLFYRGVIGNLTRNHKEALEQSDQLLADLGAPDTLRVSNLDKLSRKEALGRLDELLSFLRTKLPDFSVDPLKMEFTPELAKAHALRTLQRQLTAVVSELGERCVPFNWHDGQAHEKSRCIEEDEIGQAGIAQLLANSESAKSETLQALALEMQKEAKRREENPSPDRRINDLLFKARLARVQAYETFRSQAKPVTDAQLTWAEHLAKLEAQKVPDPLNDRSARALQYRVRELELEKSNADNTQTLEYIGSGRFGSSADTDLYKRYVETSVASQEKVLEAVRLKKAQAEEEFNAERASENEQKFAELRAKLKPLLVASEESRLSVIRRNAEVVLQSASYAASDAATGQNYDKIRAEKAKAEKGLEELKANPEKVAEQLLEETIDGLPGTQRGAMLP